MDAGRILTLVELLDETVAKLKRELRSAEPCTHPEGCQMVTIRGREWRCTECGELFDAASCPHPENALRDVSAMGSPSRLCVLCSSEIGVVDDGEANAD